MFKKSLLGSVLLLAGCSVAPTIKAPEVPTASVQQSDRKITVSLDSALNDATVQVADNTVCQVNYDIKPQLKNELTTLVSNAFKSSNTLVENNEDYKINVKYISTISRLDATRNNLTADVVIKIKVTVVDRLGKQVLDKVLTGRGDYVSTETNSRWIGTLCNKQAPEVINHSAQEAMLNLAQQIQELKY